ncbi:MAG: tRNA pseudouridine(55) synthase TruB [Candidatus Omnitrophica bacterium]|nr:tRNA pseudouridine(55) synthase TruB [Candidatus Omnitrophota bacterium]MBU4478222.1 tRNA pseudouridine(55) synthase TruB [Candidatus Omnitrophota bacterium]MCG2703378.1 tRNA pseudouridine(55) synthase TruB [Candidatus Omnitrophota bacterium]
MRSEGILLVDKAQGMTSHDVVNILRRKLGIRKIGHTGTLDPMATGLLIMLIGKATKKAQSFINTDKKYDVRLTLGVTTTTADSTGTVTGQEPVRDFSRQEIEEVFGGFQCRIQQVPPMVSAKKINGKKLYKLARKGIEVSRPAQEITIFRIHIEDIQLPHIHFNVHCSKGTYVRTLCEDIGNRLGCGAHMSALRRMACGAYSVAQALAVADIKQMDSDAVLDKLLEA